jgi:hypothetical protein
MSSLAVRFDSFSCILYTGAGECSLLAVFEETLDEILSHGSIFLRFLKEQGFALMDWWCGSFCRFSGTKPAEREI